jgi:hypothetical protein
MLLYIGLALSPFYNPALAQERIFKNHQLFSALKNFYDKRALLFSLFSLFGTVNRFHSASTIWYRK